MNGDKRKGKRVRKVPNRKWQQNEERALVNFLQQNASNFERPTAQIFYKQFTDDTHIDIDWPLIRSKVRNMRMSYARAKQWSESADDNAILNSGETIKDIQHRMFKYYDVFETLFGTSIDIGENLYPLNQTEYVKEENLSDDYQTSYTTEEICPENEASNFMNEESNECPKMTNEGDINSVDIPQRRDLKLYSSGNTPKKPRLESDESLSLQEDELQFQREKLAFEREKLKQEMAIKQKEIESQEKLKILELEMKERIALTEIKMKERVALQALERKWE